MLGLWQKADNNKVSSHRKLVDEINRLGNITPTGDLFTDAGPFGIGLIDKRLPPGDGYLDAVIVAAGPGGEPDYPDQRYWCRFAETDPIRTDQTDALGATASPPVAGGNPNVVTVTNRLEVVPDGTPGTHTLRPGQWVRVRPVFDGDTQQRWAMEEPPGVLFGVVACAGPCGEADFDDARYWVKFSRCSNNGDPDTAELSLSDDDTFPPPDCGGGSSAGDDDTADASPRIVTATNLNEADCDSHGVRPDTPVVLKWALDQGTPPRRRWFFEVADLSTCNPACPPPSSSGGSSSSDGGCPCFQITYTADPTVPPIVMEADGRGGYEGGAGTKGAITRGDGGGWVLTYGPGTDKTVYTADGAGDCPPTDVSAWTLKSGNLALLSFEPCPSSSSSGGSSGGGSSSDPGECVDVILAGTLSFLFDPDTCTITPVYETVKVRRCDLVT